VLLDNETKVRQMLHVRTILGNLKLIDQHIHNL